MKEFVVFGQSTLCSHRINSGSLPDSLLAAVGSSRIWISRES